MMRLAKRLPVSSKKSALFPSVTYFGAQLLPHQRAGLEDMKGVQENSDFLAPDDAAFPITNECKTTPTNANRGPKKTMGISKHISRFLPV
jgi:hypothetical protein